MLCFGWGSGEVLSGVGFPDLWPSLMVVGLGGRAAEVESQFAREEHVDRQHSTCS